MLWWCNTAPCCSLENHLFETDLQFALHPANSVSCQCINVLHKSRHKCNNFYLFSTMFWLKLELKHHSQEHCKTCVKSTKAKLIQPLALKVVIGTFLHLYRQCDMPHQIFNIWIVFNISKNVLQLLFLLVCSYDYFMFRPDSIRVQKHRFAHSALS